MKSLQIARPEYGRASRWIHLMWAWCIDFKLRSVSIIELF